MDKFRLIIFLLSISLQSFSQSDINPLITGDSLLSTYLSKSLDTVAVDSCFAGIYYIKFSLSEIGEIKKYDCSALMPLFLKSVIEQKLKYLKNQWSILFLGFVSKAKKMIVQPILFQIDAECSTRDNFYTKKLNMDSLNYDCDIAHALVIIFADFLATISSTFNKASAFNDQKSYLDCILMKPCIVKGIATKHRTKKM